ncbi:unnamed protein product [Peronospora belbahrii]|uniref:Uncharacterized protein n=1 Tax=Peronospora belbahrii TaxID=622444 RepID=A0ABN8CZJ8_9STRA|nr:unnamed protein product [Peronospora belbahrii]
MGGDSSATCVYDAVRTIMKLQGHKFELCDTHIDEFKRRKKMDRVAQGPAGILAVEKKPGIYLVATLDDLFRGSCFVTMVGTNKMAFAYEDGIEMGLGVYKYAKKICWNRECFTTDGNGQWEAEKAGEAEWNEHSAMMCTVPMARKPAKQRRRHTKRRPQQRIRQQLEATGRVSRRIHE